MLNGLIFTRTFLPSLRLGGGEQMIVRSLTEFFMFLLQVVNGEICPNNTDFTSPPGDD